MRKTIFPWLLDDTPLPSTLSAINAIDIRQLDGALPSILRALEQSIPPSDPMRSTNVIARLQSIAPKAPEEVVEAVRSIFAQQGWNVQGDVYQADRDFHLTITQPEIKHAKMIVERWQT